MICYDYNIITNINIRVLVEKFGECAYYALAQWNYYTDIQTP